MGTVETSDDYESCFRLLISFAYCCKKPSTVKMSEAEAQDAFIIFDEAYEGNDVDAFYLGDILRALGCNVTNAAVEAAGGATELGQKRIAFADFKPILAAVKANTSSTGVKEDYVEGLKVFDKEGTGKVPLPEVQNVLSLSVRSSRTTKPPSSANFSASSLMRRTTSPTWTSSTSSLPLPTKCLCSSNKAKDQFRSRKKKITTAWENDGGAEEEINVRTNCF